MTTQVLERPHELQLLHDVLARRRGGIVSIVGPRGAGKSFITARFAAAALDQGWLVTPYHDGRGIGVGADTTAERLRSDVLTSLGQPLPGKSSRRPLRLLTARLAKLALTTPILVIIDPYSPDSQLREELLADLFCWVRNPPVAVVIAVVSRRRLPELRATLELGVERPGDDQARASLSRALDEAGGGWDDAELEHYVRAVRSSPRLLRSLLAVLPLTPNVTARSERATRNPAKA